MGQGIIKVYSNQTGAYMKKVYVRMGVPFLCATIALTACGYQKQISQDNSGAETRSLADASIIPYYGGPKTQTTNEHGGTTYGQGTGVYSRIGSSGLHSSGISSHIESRLSGVGIDGVKVLVLDDTVILARDKEQLSSSQYDPLQHKVLNPNGGQSSRGPQSNQGAATRGSQGVNHDNMIQAREQVEALLGGNVRILTVTNPKAVALMDRIKSGVNSNSMSEQTLSQDIANLLKMTTENP
jgi:hypothetical protein